MITSTLRHAALAAATVVVSLALVSCAEPPPGQSSAPTNVATNAAPATPPAAAPQNPGDAKPPLGMEDTIEGRVVGLYCYKQNPKAPIEEQIACAKKNVATGGDLGVLGSDNTLYVDSTADSRITNAKLKDFIGEEVTIQGQMIGDAPELNFGDVKVKKFAMKLSRRKGVPPTGATPNMPKPKQSDVKGPKAKEPRTK